MNDNAESFLIKNASLANKLPAELSVGFSPSQSFEAFDCLLLLSMS